MLALCFSELFSPLSDYCLAVVQWWSPEPSSSHCTYPIKSSSERVIRMPTKFGSSFVRMGSSPLYLVCVAALVAIAAGVPQCPPGSSPCTDDSIICTEVAFGGEDLGGLKCQSDSGVNPPCQCVIALCGVSTDCPGFSNGETCNPDQCLPADTGNGCCRICADCQTPTQACPDQCELNVSTFSFDCPTACPAAECRQNSDCSAAAMEPGTCVNDFCLAPRQVGESCDDNDDCEGAIDCESNLCAAPPTPCNNNTDCPVGTVCIEVGNVLPTDCTAPSNVGDPCDDTDDCVAGLTCDGNTCKASFGGACSSGSQCLSGTCANNLCDCGTDGNPACTTAGESCIGGECKPQSGVGDECDTNDTDDCDQNLTCDGNICKASFGEACSNNNQCLSGTCTNNLCDCGTDGNPACTTAGESCIGGECKPQSGAGEECDTDDNNDCESGECNGIVCACTSNDECTDPNQTCVGPSCVPFPGENGTCDDSDDCIQSTGFCDSGNDQCGVQTCTANTDCNTGFTCIELACAAPNADGGACNDNADCTSGLCTGTTCGCEQNADCTSNGETCVVVSCVGGPVVIGGACDDNDDCETMICENNVCATDGVPEAVGGDDRKGTARLSNVI